MIEVYTDGSCEPNPGPGGWGWTRSDGQEAFGGEVGTTNNRMELMAIIRALEALPTGEATIYSDSRYCLDGLMEWRHSWARKGWTRREKGQAVPVKNADLWRRLAALADARSDVTYKWVRGHIGVAGNERADELAEQGRQSVLPAPLGDEPRGKGVYRRVAMS